MSKRTELTDALNSARRMVNAGKLAAQGVIEEDGGASDAIADVLRTALDRIDAAIEVAKR